MEKVSVQQRSPLFFVAACLLIALFSPRPALAVLTKESPEVKQMVQRGAKWLESAHDSRLGAKALVGMVMVKTNAPADHPKIVEAVQAIQKLVAGATEPQQVVDRFRDERIIYSIGLSVIFLITLDAETYQSEIQMLLRVLEHLQKDHGGWGYPQKPTGDTSMTQYAVLALWEAHHAGIEFPMDMASKAMDWLLRTQDPSGGFGYQGQVASSSAALVKQELVKPSLSAAGLSSVYVCADLLGLVQRARKESLPTGMKEIVKEDRKSVSDAARREVDVVKSRGNQWLLDNYHLDVFEFHYYLYALERYWSFREDAEKVVNAPHWYHELATRLQETQQPDGSWIGVFSVPVGQSSVPDTAFALLFLLRSTQADIEKVRNFGPGLLVGGKGLPKGTAAVELRGGQVVSKPLAGPGQQLMAALEDVESPEFDKAVAALEDMPLDAARQLVSQQEAKLRELMQGASSEARQAVVQALGKSDNLDNVPLLIHALNDPDSSVVLAARDSLRRISRKFDAFGLPDEFTESQRADAIRRWKDWYRAVRPDAEFEN